MGYTNIVTFVDDGVSGVTMDRPGFNEMMRQLEEGRASALFVKDLSRLGRNYIEVGRLMEEFFPEHNIRLVAVSDNIDTAEGENELAPIRNLFNEWYARDISNHDIKYFNCSNYNSSRGTCTSTHYIRVDFLEQVVLGEIKRLTKYAVRYEDEFLQAVMGSTQKTAELERKLKQKELANLQARDSELDGLFERIYEDNLSGKLSDERFAKMSQRYEEEQTALSEKIKTLRKELDKLSSEAVSTDMFLSTVRKYTRAKKLTPRMVNELIDHIEVYQAEKIDGEWVQKLTIHYNCIGSLLIPDTDSLPVPDVTVNTRRGVYVTYEPAQKEQ